MVVSPMTCPHCDRPYVDVERYRAHVQDCERKRQRELDEAWKLTRRTHGSAR